jgi:hypothetical protein
MAIQDRNKLKSWFITGAYPVQNQFWDWLDSYIHKSEDQISIDNVASLREILNLKADQETYSTMFNLYQQLSNDALLKKAAFIGEVNGTYDQLLLNNDAVIAKVLEGLDIPATQEYISGADTILTAFAKLQAQLYRAVILDENNKVPAEYLPAISITDVMAAADEAAMLALDAQRGDVAIRTDIDKTFILSTDDPAVLVNWKEIKSGLSVHSINGKTGVAVQLTTKDIPEDQNEYFTSQRARAAFTAGTGINISSEGQISNTDNTLQAITENGFSTNSRMRITGSSGEINSGTGLELLYTANKAEIFAIDRNPGGGYKSLAINGSKLLLNNEIAGQNGNVLIGSGAPEARLGVGGDGAFTGNVSGSDATQPTHFVTYQQLTSQFSEGIWTPDFGELSNYVTDVNASYIKSGNNVRLCLQFQVNDTLPYPQSSYLIFIKGLPFPVKFFGLPYYGGYYGTSFADSKDQPGSANQKLNLSVTLTSQGDTLYSATNEHWSDVQNKSMVIDITYVTNTNTGTTD